MFFYLISHFSASLQGNEISNGSAELNRSSENLLISSNQAVLNHRNKNQQNDIQHQFDQFQSEIKQQLHDIRREYDTLKVISLFSILKINKYYLSISLN